VKKPWKAVLRIHDPVFDPWIRDGKKSRSGITDHISESLIIIFWVKNKKIL
jgi:hypothetical protein